MELKDKLYNAEVNPPSETWARIEEALNDGHVGAAFPVKLENLDIPAPPAAWDHIIASLDSEKSNFAEKLYELEVVPPVSKWEAIEATLPVVSNGTVRSISSYLKWAVAAVLIGLAAFSIFRFGINTSSKDLASNTSNTIDSSTTIKPPASSADAIENNKVQPNTSISTSIVAAPAIMSPLKTEKRKLRNTQGENQRLAYVSKSNSNSARALFAYDDANENITDRYVMLLTPNGNFIRMSKKWGELICCVSGEDGDPDCKSELKKWQEKIADAPVTPAPGNFMDILDLVNSLNQTAEL